MKTPCWLTIGTSTCCNARWSYCYFSGQMEVVEGKRKLVNKGYWSYTCSQCKSERLKYYNN